MPEIHYEFFMNMHDSAQSAKNMQENFNRCDVFIPELMYWHPYYLSSMRKVSDGKEMPVATALLLARKGSVSQLTNFESYNLELFKMISKSGKIITLADLPMGNPTAKAISTTVSKIDEIAWKQPEYSSLDELLMDVYRQSGYLAQLQITREDYMKNYLDTKLPVLIAENRQLREKDSVNVLLSLGGFHTGLVHGMKREGYEVKSKFWPSPFIYDNFLQVQREFRFGGKPGRRLLEKAYLELCLQAFHSRSLSKVFPEGGDLFYYLNSAADQFTSDEVGDIFTYFHNLGQRADMNRLKIGLGERDFNTAPLAA